MLKHPRRIFSFLVLTAVLAGCIQARPSTNYTVDINPAAFVDAVSNPYFPLTPGARYVYESKTAEGTERTEVEVLPERRKVMGIMATVVRDRVYLNGELIEDTFDWYAQDSSGDVWYLGEEVSNFENGRFVDHAGSWEAGVDGALPGIIMFANPGDHIGDTYQQEYYQGVAEDKADLVSASEQVDVPVGSFDQVVQTRDYTPLEPDLLEYKYYATGVGMVKEVNPETGEELVLVEYFLP